MDKLAGFVGRMIYAIPFLGLGFVHLTNARRMEWLVPPYIPGGVFWVYFTGAAMVLAALAILTGRHGRKASFGLALMLLAFIVTVHLPGMTNPATKMVSTMNFFKDMGLMGGALVIAGTFKK